MSEVISFWLDNKTVAGHRVVEIGDQVLVDYRGRFYIVSSGSAVMSGSRAKQYSRTSLPPLWKKALKGELPPVEAAPEAIVPEPAATRPPRTRKTRESTTMPESPTPAAADQKPPVPSRSPKPARKTEASPAAQAVVPAGCPYCGQRNEIPVEKGKNGKPFFIACTKCAREFAVRFVPVTQFQAQVAGFH